MGALDARFGAHFTLLFPFLAVCADGIRFIINKLNLI